MKKINLLKSISKFNRNVTLRKINKTSKVIKIAQKFGREYFDGSRKIWIWWIFI